MLLGLLHFFWMRAAKNNFAEVAVYAVVIAVLLGWRLARRLKPRTRVTCVTALPHGSGTTGGSAQDNPRIAMPHPCT